MILSWIAFYLDPKKTGRKVTEKAILSLADQQLITGLALLISAHVNRHRYTLYKEDKDDYQDAHFILVIYQSCLSISSFLSGILIQEKPLKKPVITIIRAVVTASYALFILWTVGESYHAFDPIMYLWLGRPRPDENEIFSWRIISLRRRWSMVGLALLFPISAISLSQSPGPNGRLTIACALAWQSFYVIVFAVLVLKQKFTHPPPVTDDASEAGIKRWCGLNNPGDNEWVFGQTVAVVMLLLPLMTTIEAYYGMLAELNTFLWLIVSQIRRKLRSSKVEKRRPPKHNLRILTVLQTLETRKTKPGVDHPTSWPALPTYRRYIGTKTVGGGQSCSKQRNSKSVQGCWVRGVSPSFAKTWAITEILLARYRFALIYGNRYWVQLSRTPSTVSTLKL